MAFTVRLAGPLPSTAAFDSANGLSDAARLGSRLWLNVKKRQ